MQLILSPAAAWQSAPDWDRHRNYYLHSGADVFLEQEVPYNITSNPCFTAQASQLLKCVQESCVPEQPMRILELGAGLGLFALHLLDVFSAEGIALEYWLTDLSENTLRYLAQQPPIQHWVASGQLKLCIFDALSPQQVVGLDGQAFPLPECYFQAVIANYHFSTLPTAVLYKQPQGWYQKTVQYEIQLGDTASLAAFLEKWKSFIHDRNWLAMLPDGHPQWAYFAALQATQEKWARDLSLETLLALPSETELRAWLRSQICADWQQALRQSGVLATDYQEDGLHDSLDALLLQPFLLPWLELDLPILRRDGLEQIDLTEFCADVRIQAQLEQLTANLPLATISFPLSALTLLDVLQHCLSETACWLISDKGYADTDWMQGVHQEEASHHGDSLSHPVNFPLLAALYASRGFQSQRTCDAVFALQTLWAYRSREAQPTWAATFNTHFIQQNHNEESHAWLEAGHQFLKSGLHEQAFRCLSRALRLRPSDATLLYLQSVNLLQQEKYVQAWDCLNRDNDDYFHLFNFAVLRAETCRLLENYSEAIPHYQEALSRYGQSSTVLYNLGLCFEALHQNTAARQSWQAALALNPDDEEIQASLAALGAE